MRPLKILRWLGLALGGALALGLLGLAAVVAIGAPIDLGRLRAPVEAAASAALDREMALEGPLVVVPGLRPELWVEAVRIANHPGWTDADLARLGQARLRAAVLPLLRGEIEIDEILAEGIILNLERRADGSANWQPTGPRSEPTPEPAAPTGDDTRPAAIASLDLDRLSLRDLQVAYRDAAGDRPRHLRLAEVTGAAARGQPLRLALQGDVEDRPFQVDLTGGSLEDLLANAPWPLQVRATALGSELRLDGRIDEPLAERGLDLSLELSGESLVDLERLLGRELPPVDAYRLAARLRKTDGSYRLDELTVRIGETGLSGRIEADLSGPRPRLTGRLAVDAIDAGPVFAAIEAERAAAEDDAPAEAPAEAPASEAPSLETPLLDLAFLHGFDADFEMTLDEVVNAPLSFRQARLAVQVSEGRLSAPLSVVFAEVPFSGRLELTDDPAAPDLALSMTAEESDLGALGVLLPGIPDARGRFRSGELAVSARGASLLELLRSTDFRFALTGADLSYGHGAADRPIAFTLERAELTLPPGGAMRFAAEGSLLDEAFTLTVTGGGMADLLRDRRWPLELDVRGGGATLAASGTVVLSEDGIGSAVDLQLSGDRLGDLSAWLGVSPELALPYAVEAGVRVEAEQTRIELDDARIGASSVSGRASGRLRDDAPELTLALDFDTLDLVELQALKDAADPPQLTPAAPESPALLLDVPILPQGVDLSDADIDLSVHRLAMRPLPLTDLALSADIRDGRIEAAPLRAALLETEFVGSFDLDLTGAVPRAGLTLGVEALDLGRLLAELGIADGLELTAGGLQLDADLEGSSARELLAASSLEVELEAGSWRLRDANTGGSLEIALPRGSLTAAPGQPTALDLDGRIDDIPVRIVIDTDPLTSFNEERRELTLNLDVALLRARLQMTGTTPLPLRPDSLRLDLDLAGERLDDFDALLDLSLPPLGPYAVAGGFALEPTGYRIEGMDLRIGDSALSGDLALATDGAKARLDIDLRSPRIQLDDFDTGDWSMTPEADDPPAADPEAERAEAAARARRAEALLSPEAMGRLDARLAVAVEQVLSGADELGNGSLVATLEAGRFAVEPLTLTVPGGRVEVGFAYRPHDDGVEAEARAAIDRLDYGLLARRIDPASEAGGLISLDVDLTAQSPSLREIMNGADGNIGLAIWPNDLDAGIFDLWAVNLLTAVLPSVDDESRSRINCFVARFSIVDGVMTPDALLVDSTRVQASGDGRVDFRSEEIEFVLAPRPKRPQFFSARTPIQVKGTIADFSVGVRPGAILGTLTRMTTSVVTTPFEWVFTRPVEPDGEAACAEAWGQVDVPSG